MAVGQLSRALHAPAHPMASPGFGKREAPDQEPRRKGDFAHLPTREAAVAQYIDRLPEGADISIKTLAREMAAYGQCAIGTALNALTAAGHLHRRRIGLMDDEGNVRHVTESHFSRTPRPAAWWHDVFTESVPSSGYDDPEPGVSERGGGDEGRGFRALARLGRREPQLALSENECYALAETAGEWFRRGASETQLVYALTLLLPARVTHPFGFVQARLLAKLPPELPPAPLAVPMTECVGCGAAGRPEDFTGGLCRPCRSTEPVRCAQGDRGGCGRPACADPACGPSPKAVRGKAARIRREMRLRREREGTRPAHRPRRARA
ncbi:hypothetical protein OG897_02475 [Streptomyces sp. NBC_00237]|uniref:hypothetical protein n=1 Tax=Streptomyces sp. NBC_00237 TaxID=2975687 RepID=UPI002259172D|nr:hypothetical protein [Streptomyces sp. NBC_00237]MCX5200330.1 hypothetical protein [Streptomyces sp. NBC_00237]